MVACPYGRFQSVLLDRRSLIVGYDYRRGEPRGQLARRAAPTTPPRRGRLRRLRRLRRDVPDGYRHPRRAADGVHPLHAVHGRVRLGHGAHRPPARTDPLQLARRAGGGAPSHPAAAHRDLPAALAACGACSAGRSRTGRAPTSPCCAASAAPSLPALGRGVEPDPDQDRQPVRGRPSLPDRAGRRRTARTSTSSRPTTRSRGGACGHGHGLRDGAASGFTRARGRCASESATVWTSPTRCPIGCSGPRPGPSREAPPEPMTKAPAQRAGTGRWASWPYSWPGPAPISRSW